MKYTITMNLFKETKGALCYEEFAAQDAPAKIGTLYVRKDRMGGEQPQVIKVTVESV